MFLVLLIALNVENSFHVQIHSKVFVINVLLLLLAVLLILLFSSIIVIDLSIIDNI